jgi:hypothetical protein
MGRHYFPGQGFQAHTPQNMMGTTCGGVGTFIAYFSYFEKIKVGV